MNSKRVEEILGRAKRFENSARDYDHDKVSNVIDCKPYNKHKQGIIHDIGKRIVQRYKEDNAAREIRNRKAKTVYYQEKEKVALESARRSAREGGFGRKLVTQISQAARPQRMATAKRKQNVSARLVRRKGLSDMDSIPTFV